MAAELSICGAVLCGGRSVRFGSDKALAPFGHQLLGQHVAGALRQAGIDPVVAVGGDSGPALGLVTLADRWPNAGPLGGTATVLRWASTDHVVVAPCDLAGLEPATVRAMLDRLDEVGPSGAVVASVEGKRDPTLGVWPTSWRRRVTELVETGERRWTALTQLGPVASVAVAPDQLFDIDTKDDLDRF